MPHKVIHMQKDRPGCAKAPGRYTMLELAELREIHCELVRTEILNYGEGGALWRRLEGLFADLPASPLLRMADDALREEPPQVSPEDRSDLLSRIGARTAFPIQENNAEFFEQLAVILRARRESRALHSLTAKELGIHRVRGRKPTRVDLSRAFPLALLGVTMKRSKDHAVDGKFSNLKVSRDELLEAIQIEQLKAGLKNPPKISSNELYRWLAAYQFERFMGEQPIARKRLKNP